MLLGKRQRPPIKRTTSMTGITVDVSNIDEHDSEPAAVEQNYQNHMILDMHATNFNHLGGIMNYSNINGYDQRFLESMLSPRNHRVRNMSGHDFLDTSQFLRICGLCKRRLAPGKDIYMYRGDTAYCSLECREEQMKQDERKDRYALASSSKKDKHPGTQQASSSKGSIRAGQ